jgi:uncharacterized protein
MAHVLVQNTHGKDNLERASLAFVVANTALNANQRSTVLLTIEGVWTATRGYLNGAQAHGFAPLGELVEQFVANGGELWVCGACAKPRNVTQEQLIAGAQIVGAATAVEAMANGAQTLSL